MAITIEHVEKVAILAKLSFDKTQMQKLTKELDQIVSYVEKLNELKTDEIAPTSHMIELRNVFREDRAQSWLSQEEALKSAPHAKDGYLSIPKVMG